MIGGVLTERTVGTVLPAVKENMGKLKVLFASMVLRIWAHDAAYCLSLLFARQAVLLAFWRLRRLLVGTVGRGRSWGKMRNGKSLGSNAVPCGSACVLSACISTACSGNGVRACWD